MTALVTDGQMFGASLVLGGLVAWFVCSIPLGVAVGRLLARKAPR